MLKKTYKDNKGFTLTEVMVGIMILTMAIVAASNMLVTLMRSNEVNLTSLQAQYFAQEGIEGVRNIRDSNWLNNKDWLGSDSEAVWEKKFQRDQSYNLTLKSQGFFNTNYDEKEIVSISSLFNYSSWIVSDDVSEIVRCKNGKYFGECKEAGEEENTVFKRTISIKPYYCFIEDLGCDDNNTVLVESKVEWNVGANQRSLSLHTVLTNWKGGVF